MKKLCVLTIILLLLSGCIFSVSADTTLPYENYTYSESDSSVIGGPQAYIPDEVIFGNNWGIGALSEPTDMDIDSNGNLYILDAGNCRVVVLGSDYTLKTSFICKTDDGNTAKIVQAQGITVTNDYLYICDTENSRILVYKKDNGDLYKTVGAPVSSKLGNEFIFKPTKVAVDKKGNLYVVCKGTYDGVINMSPESEFFGFFAANNVTSSPWELFWRRFSTTAQRKTMVQLVPQDFSSIDIDDDGFYFITTQTAVNSSMVKRVNQGGVDIIRKLSNVTVTGDQTKVRKGSLMGNSSFIDVAAGPEKIYACLDSTRGKIFCYNNDGYLLYTFGTIASQKGGFMKPMAITYLDDWRIAVLDGGNSSVTVFKTTDYADTINLGISYQNALDYEKAYVQWGKVLEYNCNYQLAQNMMGYSCYNTGDYELAMAYFESCNNNEMYSSAREAIRSNWIYANISMIVAVVLIVIAVVIAFKIRGFYKVKKKQ